MAGKLLDGVVRVLGEVVEKGDEIMLSIKGRGVGQSGHVGLVRGDEGSWVGQVRRGGRGGVCKVAARGGRRRGRWELLEDV